MEKLIEELRAFRDDRDWSQFHTLKDLAISVSVEANELLELFQWRADTKELTANEKGELASEAADVLLYLLLLCDKADLDLEEAALLKLEQNKKRFPIPSSKGVAKPIDMGGEE